MKRGNTMDSDYRRERLRRKRRKRRIRRIKQIFRITLVVAVFLLLILLAVKGFNEFRKRSNLEKAENMDVPDWIDVDLIDSWNPSRSGEKLDAVNDIVVHYVGNPGTTAKQNRDYYNHLDSNVSSHFVIGLEGEIIMCLPLNEKSAASNDRNHDTISIEVCHPDEDGKFTDASYQSLIKLVDWLMDEFHLDKDNVIRHYDVTGKECPRYYVLNPEAWEQFKNDL
ncbi:MAG: N-acetylmuramoyl-L-alanine amidase [Lachnospiraceae bacterium]|nr:N-acetylmuramoyl-L-alanine amidase [Lachnospiraceae bacterium]